MLNDQEIPWLFLWYPTYHYRVHKGTPDPYVSQMILAHTFMSTTNPRHLI